MRNLAAGVALAEAVAAVLRSRAQCPYRPRGSGLLDNQLRHNSELDGGNGWPQLQRNQLHHLSVSERQLHWHSLWHSVQYDF